MASVSMTIAGRHYTIGCQAGEEERLTALAGIVDKKAQESVEIIGSNTTEARQLLFAALLLADDLIDQRPAPGVPTGPTTPAISMAELEQLAVRLEMLASTLERRA